MQHDHDDHEARSRRGEVIDGRYVVGDVLGIGGMGVVYAAVQRSLDRAVALKVPRRALATDPGVCRRFRNEGLAGSRVDHPNIARVLDYGMHAGSQFLVMELAAGRPLGELLAARGTMSVATAVGLVRQIVAALAHVHGVGIVHGDVKCGNILVEILRDGRAMPRLIDFGLARIGPDSARPDGEDRLVSGTPEYLAPELIRGEPLTYPSDVYSVGIVLYELLSGATPFAGGKSAEILRRHLETLPVPLSWRCRAHSIPPALDHLVARALAKQPSERFADAAELATALDAIELDASSVLRPAPSSATAFSTEATTATLHVAGEPTIHEPTSLVDQRRAELATTLAEHTDLDAIVVAHLELARALVDERVLADAITVLEHGIAELSRSANGVLAPLWRVQLTLAALYDHLGRHTLARTTAQAAQANAARVGSTVGEQRARHLLARLVQGRRGSLPAW
jgi:serine/threonine-protein kinase